MIVRIWAGLALAGISVLVSLPSRSAQACCAAGPSGKPVVNADQTVILIWDAANKTQHFIRQASFKSESDGFGFLVPSPTEPKLDESDNEAFSSLRKLTEPEVVKRVGFESTGKQVGKGGAREVTVLQPEKLVAGFHAVVLETTSSAALAKWLKDNGYHFSPEVEAWAKPYVELGWKITALKLAGSKNGEQNKNVSASAFRMSFQTDQPVFPYREPDSRSYVDALRVSHRLLRIYFLAEARYDGVLTKESPWTGQAVWAGKVKSEDRKNLLRSLKLPQTTGPAEWWLTEFEDRWPYQVAPADVIFSRSDTQEEIRRPPIIVEVMIAPESHYFTIYTSLVVVGILVVVLAALLYVRRRRI
jgi:Uncharacterized protein conserved in bacteria (DUF2330)